MNSRIKKRICLLEDGFEVDVKGPIFRWDDDERSAVFSVVIAQMNAAGEIVIATGSSNQYRPDADHWRATATAAGDSPLELGPATATATATIETIYGGLESYTWSLLTRLVDCSDGEPED